MVVSSDKIIAFRFLSSQKFGQSSRDLQMIRFARLPALARGRCLWAQPGPRCCQGGQEAGRAQAHAGTVSVGFSQQGRLPIVWHISLMDEKLT